MRGDYYILNRQQNLQILNEKMEPFELQEKDMAIEVPFRMCVAGASGEKRNREIVFEEIQFLTY